MVEKIKIDSIICEDKIVRSNTRMSEQNLLPEKTRIENNHAKIHAKAKLMGAE